jgi:RNA polymerase sigma-70 factor (ECF subfamily)
MASIIAENDERFVAALRSGDESAFLSLVDRHHAAMLRVCRIYVADQAVAEEVVQDTWLDMLQGLERFEGRSSLKTWLFSILTNNARTRSKRESRSIPFSSIRELDLGEDEPAVNPERFLLAGHRWAGHWAEKPQPWGRSIEEQTLSNELLVCIHAAIERLPESQRLVITMRDVEGWQTDEVCNILGLTETNQRVLLHRARSKVRQALELYYDEEMDVT